MYRNFAFAKVIRSAVPPNNFIKMFIHIYLLPPHVSALVGLLLFLTTVLIENAQICYEICFLLLPQVYVSYSC
jgi:hypothetical protein